MSSSGNSLLQLQDMEVIDSRSTYENEPHILCKSVEVYKGQENTNTTMSFTL